MSDKRIWPVDEEALLTKIRSAGWSVAIHNDYRQNGNQHTFWLFTNVNGRWVKGEGRTDREALECVARELAAKESSEQHRTPPAFPSLEQLREQAEASAAVETFSGDGEHRGPFSGAQSAETGTSARNVSPSPCLTLPDGRPAWPFRLADALAEVKNVATRDGRSLSLLFLEERDECPLKGIVGDKVTGGKSWWTLDGKRISEYANIDLDLFMLTPPKPPPQAEPAKPPASVEQMCRKLLQKVVDEDVLVLGDESNVPGDLKTEDLSGMANMLQGFLLRPCSFCESPISPSAKCICDECRHAESFNEWQRGRNEAANPLGLEAFDYERATRSEAVCLADGTVVSLVELRNNDEFVGIRISSLPEAGLFPRDGTHPLGARLFMAKKREGE